MRSGSAPFSSAPVMVMFFLAPIEPGWLARCALTVCRPPPEYEGAALQSTGVESRFMGPAQATGEKAMRTLNFDMAGSEQP